MVFATFFNNALQFYTQVETYPLFGWVPREGFVAFHEEYQRRLPVAIYAPYALLMVSNVLLALYINYERLQDRVVCSKPNYHE